MLYKIHHQEVAIGVPDKFIPQKTSSILTRRKHSEQYNIISTRTDTYKHSFYPSIIPIWNQLPASTIQSPSLEIFRSKIQETVHSGQPELYMGSEMPVAVPIN